MWVPSEFVRGAFLRAGLPESLVLRVPETIDLALFDPDATAPRMLFDPSTTGVRLPWLAVFKWEARGGAADAAAPARAAASARCPTAAAEPQERGRAADGVCG